MAFFDRHTVFADKLVLPRMMLPLQDGLLVRETGSEDFWLYRDLNDDGVADEKIKIYEGDSDSGNIEHQSGGLIWNLDNWIYVTMSSQRFRLRGTNVLVETIPSNGGQWGLSHDDYGKQWFVNAGGNLGPIQFQQPFHYGRFSVSDELETGFKEVWPLAGLGDVEEGKHRFRPEDGTLNHFTSTCGGEIFRGDRLPSDLRGDFFFAEPVGRLIRHARVEVSDGITRLRNAYPKSEFIRSTDPNFRPVNLTTAPDGTLYIVDMYRGIIQEGAWLGKDSYLRKVIENYQLDKNFGRGRIWRLVHQDRSPGDWPMMNREPSSRLVQYLDHPNGWWRDTAQKLIVLRQDLSVVPVLRTMAQTHSNHLARIHALWTLEGLDVLDTGLLLEKMRDDHPQVRVAAIRAYETLEKQGEASLRPAVVALADDPDPNVVIQVLLTARFLQWPDANQIIQETIAKTSSQGVREIGTQLIIPQLGDGRELTQYQKDLLLRGEQLYRQLCFACHGSDGKGTPDPTRGPRSSIAPRLAQSETVTGLSDIPVGVLLKGLTGPLNGKEYPSSMVAFEQSDDEWIAAVVSYIRNAFGNNASLVFPGDVARVRKVFAKRDRPWTISELQKAVPQYLPNRKSWKLKASHGSSSLPELVDNYLGTRYESETDQVPGMWVQVDLPQTEIVSGLLLNGFGSPYGHPRAWKVELSRDGINWDDPVAEGRSNARSTEIRFAPRKTKAIRITLTEAAEAPWHIHELHVLVPPS